MIGLRTRARDTTLVARCGDRAVPSDSEITALVAEHFGTTTSVELVYARWKPRKALCLGYAVTLGGAPRYVTLKLHTGAKARALAAAQTPQFAVEPELGATLSLFPFDRELPGLARCLDLRRVARHVDALGVFAPFGVRPGPSRVETLRYKPERRAVLRLALKLRERDGSPRVARDLVARVHTPRAAERIAAARGAFDSVVEHDIAPRLVHCEARTGTVLEEWLPVRPCVPEDFSHAREAGALLARLHATPCAAAAPADEPDASDELFAIDPALRELAGAAPQSASASATTWTHGDFHPDQLARHADGRLRLLDLDQLGPGSPARDLASWIADRCAHDGVDWRTAAEALLDGYRGAGGCAVSERELAAAIARALRQLAAGAIRRLEHDALARAAALLELAREIAPRPSSPLAIAVAAVVARAPGAIVERVDRGRDARALVAVSTAGQARWFATRGANATELAPDQDDELPLSRALAGGEIGGTREVLAYKPGRRIVVRAIASDGSRSIVKGYRAGRSSAAALAHRVAERAALALRVRVPRLIACDPQLAALTFEDLGGRVCALRHCAPERLGAFGDDLRRFQLGASDGLSRHDATRELAVLDEHAARVLELDGELPERWRDECDVLATSALTLPSAPLVLAHRDLHDGQLLALGERFGWIDFDLACAADSALDAANFCAHVELRVLQGALAPDLAAQQRAHFLAGFDGAHESGFDARFDFYLRASCLRLALVYRLRPRWSHLSAALVELAAQLPHA